MRSSAERETAARLLVRVAGGAFASRLLEETSSSGIRVRVLGVLRWERLLDETISGVSRRPLEKLDAEVLAVLRLGLFEAAILGVPVPVATDGSVRLVRRLGKGSAAGMVNAVLRVANTRLAAVRDGAPPDVRLSHPRWLFERWRNHFGIEAAVAAMEAAQRPADLWVWWTSETARERAAATIDGLEEHPWCPGAWRAPSTARALIPAVRAGEAYAQDPASQLAGHLAAGLARELERPRLVDLCAAPGGKTALTLARRPSAAAGSGEGSRVWGAAIAMDLHAGRTRLLRDNLERMGCRVPVVTGDAGFPPLQRRAWDVVVLDAPCSGTGTLRRHPELRRRLREQDLRMLAERQRRLVTSALDLVAPGGRLLYTTCSVEPEENEALFEPPFEGFEAVSLGALLPAGCPAHPTSAGGIRLLPAEEADGFTYHAVTRIIVE